MKADDWSFVASILCGLTAAIALPQLVSLLDRMNSRFLRDLTERAEELGMQQRQLELLMRWWWGLTVAMGAIVGGYWKMTPVAIVLCLLAVTLPRSILSWINEHQRIRLRDQMVGASRLLAAQFRAGLSDTEAIRAVAIETPHPLGKELRRCVAEFDAGATVRDSLTALKDRLQIDAVTLFVVTLLTCKSTGGKVTDAMENISRSLQELQRVERKRESDTAGGRTLVLVLAAFPLGMSAMLWMIDSRSMGLVFSTLPGQLVLSSILLMTYGSIRWAHWLVSALE